jgi:hypothetical protein
VKLIIDKTTDDWGEALEEALDKASPHRELPHKAPKPNSRRGNGESGEEAWRDQMDKVKERHQRGRLEAVSNHLRHSDPIAAGGLELPP